MFSDNLFVVVNCVTIFILGFDKAISRNVFLRLLTVFLRNEFLASLFVDVFSVDFLDRAIEVLCVTVFILGFYEFVVRDIFLRLSTVLLRNEFFTSCDIVVTSVNFLIVMVCIAIFIFSFYETVARNIFLRFVTIFRWYDILTSVFVDVTCDWFRDRFVIVISFTSLSLSFDEFVVRDIFLRLISVFLRCNFFTGCDIEVLSDSFIFFRLIFDWFDRRLIDWFVVVNCVTVFSLRFNELIAVE